MFTNEDYLNIFHEIKNSITLINGSLQLISKKHPEVCDFAYWTDATTELNHLKDIVMQVSSARLCSQPEFAPTDLYAFTEQISSASRALSPTGNVCKIQIEENLPAVEMDSVLLKHALINLMKNSYEAADTFLPVEFHLFLRDNLLHIVLTDHAGGLAPDIAERIFQPFVTGKTNGSGLGLVITRQIVEAHHGTISCTSRPGDGCTFTITIPVRQN